MPAARGGEVRPRGESTRQARIPQYRSCRIVPIAEARIPRCEGAPPFSLERREGELRARLTGAQGSNLLTSMGLAQGLAICPEDLPKRPAGEKAVVQLLDWLDHSSILTDHLDITR